jgi:hypothetical protein
MSWSSVNCLLALGQIECRRIIPQAARKYSGPENIACGGNGNVACGH